MRLYYLGTPGDMFGWGICNTNLVRELSRLCDLALCQNTKRKDYESPVFVPIADHDLNPVRKVHAPFRIGYCFFESPLGDKAEHNARHCYDYIFAGSSWCVRKLLERGIKSSLLVQGVDFEEFVPQPYPDNRPGFRVFSGGKWEYRKGQDIVLSAMRVFMKSHGDVVLVAAWHNPWQQSANTMRRSVLITEKEPLKDIIRERLILLPVMNNDAMPEIYGQTDVGLFPNRCEGGTNLVLMEYMACARPVIATYKTGHMDVLTGPGPYLLTQGDDDLAGWWHNDVSDILVALENAYNNRQELRERGNQCRALIEPWTWKRAALTILDAVRTRGTGQPRS